MDTATPLLPPVLPQMLRVAKHWHKKGLMYLYFFHILMSEIKIAVSLKMNPVNICLLPPYSIGQFVNMYTESCLAGRKRKENGKICF